MTPQAMVAVPQGDAGVEGGPELSLHKWDVSSGSSNRYQVGLQFRSGEEAIENSLGTLGTLFGK